MRNVLIVALIGLLFASCKKDDNTSNDYDLPIVVEDTTAEFNVLFYGNTCLDCVYAHFNLYVDDVYLGAVFDCGTEECSCDNNPSGLRAIVAFGTHTFKAIPYCGWIEDGKLVDEGSGGQCSEGTFDVPEDNCVSVHISEF